MGGWRRGWVEAWAGVEMFTVLSWKGCSGKNSHTHTLIGRTQRSQMRRDTSLSVGSTSDMSTVSQSIMEVSMRNSDDG